MAEEFRVLRPREYHTQLITKGIRADGRQLEEVRDIKLEIDAIRTADSSSLVKIGNTCLVCGCIAQLVGNQNKSDQDNNIIRIKVELPPICSTPAAYKFQHTAQLLTKSLTDILEETNCLDKRNFYIDHLDSHWELDIEVICLNYDGCLQDAALIAILSALKSLTLTSNQQDVPDRSVIFNTIPTSSTFSMIGNRIICDPNMEEEAVAQCTFSIIIDSTNNLLSHVNKIGGKSLSTDNLFKCIELAKHRSQKLKKMIDDIRNKIDTRMSIDS